MLGTERNSSSDIDVNIKLICHICNIKVPKIFMKNHINSPKHKIYLKIANTAMSRINKNTNQNILISKCKSSLHFCDVCVVAVENKMDHISSDYHRIAVKKEKMFKSLVEMYANDCDIHSDESESCDKENVSTASDESSDEEISNEFKEIDDNTKEVLSKERETDNQVKIFNARTKSHVLKSLDGKYYIIETKDGVQIKVERDNYHGFKKIGKRKYACQLCSSFCQRKGNHILTEKHLKNISNVIGYHCIREVDTSTTHCIICNELIESYLLHTMCNEKHIELLKNSLIHTDDPDVNGIKSKISINNTIHEKEPNKSDGSHKTVDVGSLKLQANEVKVKLPSQNPVEHLLENANTNLSQLNKTNEIIESKEQKNIIPINVSTKQNSELISETSLHPDLYMIKTTNQEKSCYFCDVPIPNTTRNINEHLDGSKHKQTVKEILNINGLLVKNGSTYCKYCHNNMVKEYQYYHIQLESHKANIIAVKKINVKESNIDKINTSKDIEIKTKEDSIQEINNGTTEIDIPSVMEKTPKGNEISCKICNVIVPLRTSNIQDHLEGNKHMKNLMELLDNNKIIIKETRNFCELCSFYIQDNMNYEHIISYFHMRKLEIHENNNKNDAKSKRLKTVFTYILNILESGNLLCTVCNVIIPNKESNITEHINGKKHISKETDVFKKNKLIINDMNSYCDICSLYILKGSEHDHIKTKLHEDNMNRKSDKTDNIDQIPQSNNSTEYIGIVQSTPHVVRCTLCNVDVPDSVHTLNMHVQGTKHKSNFKTLFPNQ
ncbi:PREDICTED: uncharacterized protein LOC106103065 isoform X3 [Papilio polytes]|uniref:uncharacterized protein LOC106103065 isoform X3 n=1 Tax=Papilio polytes TaxID=76194 RepID=UPI000675F0BA|nr:PREDICTED: uncharacterized protein LOC106103065 isoform X3 [Papilio polytes]